MRKMTVLLALLNLMMLTACANSPTKSGSSTIVKTPKVLEIEQKLRDREEALQDAKDRQKVLTRKSKMEGSSSSSVKVGAVPQNKRIELMSPGVSKSRNDRELYAELVGSFDRNNEIAFFSRFQSFQQNYAKSPLADDAVYLAGVMSLSNKNYGPALKYLNEVLKKYPSSNKATAALFAKGVALKKMNLTDESRQVFAKVRKAYPGSPEALRAETELKLLTR